MSTTWETPAGVLIEFAEPDWHGLWSLLYTASHAAMRLSLGLSLAAGVDVMSASLDLREARDELEWLYEHLATGAIAIDLGPLHRSDEPVDARHVVGRLADAILERTYALIDAGTAPAETACLARVAGKVFTARTSILGDLP